MKNLCFYLFLASIICSVYIPVRAETECRIQVNSPTVVEQQHQSVSAPCKLHSRYDKISDNKLSCTDVCFISTDYSNPNNKLFFELTPRNQLLLTSVDRRTRNFKIVSFKELGNTPFQISKTHSIGSKIYAIIRGNGQQYLATVDPLVEPVKTELIPLGRDGLVDAILGDPVVVITAEGSTLIKKRVDADGINDGEDKGYVIARFEQPIKRVWIINDKIRVEVDDEERDIPVINCSVKEEAEFEDACDIPGPVVENVPEFSAPAVPEAPPSLPDLPPPSLPELPPPVFRNEEEKENEKMKPKAEPEAEEYDDGAAVVVPKTLPPFSLEKSVEEKKVVEEADGQIIDVIPQDESPENDQVEDPEPESESAESAEKIVPALPTPLLPNKNVKIMPIRPEIVHTLPTDDDLLAPAANKSSVQSSKDSKFPKPSLSGQPQSYLIFLIVIVLVLLVIICCCTKALHNRIKRRHAPVVVTQKQGSSYQPLAQSKQVELDSIMVEEKHSQKPTGKIILKD